MPGLACPFSSARTRPFARGLACARADLPCGTEIQVRRSVGLTTWSAMLTAGGVDGGGEGGAAMAGSWISPASLEKRRSGGAARRTAMVASGRGVADPFGNGVTAALADPVADGVDEAGAALGGGVDEDEGPATGGMAAKATGIQLDAPAMSDHGGWYGAAPCTGLQAAKTPTAGCGGTTRGSDARRPRRRRRRGPIAAPPALRVSPRRFHSAFSRDSRMVLSSNGTPIRRAR